MIGWPVRAAVLVRALAVQGSWNYETLTGTGFGFAILPALRAIHGEPEALEEAVRRHEEPFNSHPYLAPVALGAVIRMEAEGTDPALIKRFKAAVRGSLGTLGDQIVWTGLRPLCVLLGLALVLVGVPWWGAVAAFLCTFNAGHLGIMAWGFHIGLSDGRHVAERLRHPFVRRIPDRLMTAGSFMAGAVIALVLTRGVAAVGDPGWGWRTLAVAAGTAGAVLGATARRAGVAGAMALAVVGLLMGVLT